MTEDYISFETAKLLKEKGFNEECSRFYMPNGHGRWKYEHYHDFDISNRIECPTLQMAMKWLREVHKLAIIIFPQWAQGDMRNPCMWRWEIRGLENINPDMYGNPLYSTYEEATEAAIKYCLENLI